MYVVNSILRSLLVLIVILLLCCTAILNYDSISDPETRWPSSSISDDTVFSRTNPFLSVPVPNYTRPITMETEWVSDLYRAVKQLQGKQVTLLVCDRGYLDVLVNWLAQAVLHASHPVDSILIIAFDTYTYHLLHHKGFHSVYIPLDTVISPEVPPSVKRLRRMWITRLTFIRLINYWGYSVLVIDTDALMIRNVQPLLDKFDTSDIIASGGSHPTGYSRKWKAPTMCMGFILIKSSPATGSLLM